MSELGGATPGGAATPEGASADQDRSLLLPPALSVPAGIEWGCPQGSCEYRERGRVERASGDGICPEHGEPLVRANG